jgi:hypothetical protein
MRDVEVVLHLVQVLLVKMVEVSLLMFVGSLMMIKC